jgi:hypothetical protein
MRFLNFLSTIKNLFRKTSSQSEKQCLADKSHIAAFEKEGLVFHKPMMIGRNGDGYSCERYTKVGNEIVGDCSIWDFSKDNPFIGGEFKIVGGSNE